MARPAELLVVDGYNVIHKSQRYMDLVDQPSGRLGDTDPFGRARQLLIADVAAYAQGRYEAVVVFDAAGNVSPERPNLTVAGVRTVFSRHHVRAVTVITSDNTIRATVGGVPVTRVSSDVLIADVGAIVEDVRAANEERNHQHLTLEDRLDPKTRQKLDRLLGRL